MSLSLLHIPNLAILVMREVYFSALALHLEALHKDLIVSYVPWGGCAMSLTLRV